MFWTTCLFRGRSSALYFARGPCDDLRNLRPLLLATLNVRAHAPRLLARFRYGLRWCDLYLRML